MEESELLYGDLEATGLSEELKRKQKENDRLRKEKNEIESELKDARDQIKSVTNDNKVLEENLLAVWNTARAEIDRKDKMIAKLNKELVELRAQGHL